MTKRKDNKKKFFTYEERKAIQQKNAAKILGCFPPGDYYLVPKGNGDPQISELTVKPQANGIAFYARIRSANDLGQLLYAQLTVVEARAVVELLNDAIRFIENDRTLRLGEKP